jgi:hypothetical protein
MVVGLSLMAIGFAGGLVGFFVPGVIPDSGAGGWLIFVPGLLWIGGFALAIVGGVVALRGRRSHA